MKYTGIVLLAARLPFPAPCAAPTALAGCGGAGGRGDTQLGHLLRGHLGERVPLHGPFGTRPCALFDTDDALVVWALLPALLCGL